MIQYVSLSDVYMYMYIYQLSTGLSIYVVVDSSAHSNVAGGSNHCDSAPCAIICW